MTAFPLDLADRCVKCGLCLPHCPTYGVSGHEGDSPRGRIALMQALASGALPVSERLEAHLDGCLGCRACEAVCPAQVPYGQLLDAGRVLLGEQKPPRRRAARRLAALLVRRPLRGSLLLLIWLYQQLGIQRLVRACGVLGHGRLARLESLAPEVQLRRLPRRSGPATGPAVFLFENCVSPLAERQVIADAQRLLGAAGFAVHRPRGQTCCGALLQHAGLPSEAQVLARNNVAALAGTAPVLSVATGCTAELKAYGQRLGAEGAALAERVQDVTQFLLQHGDGLRFRPLRARVAIHRPCTLQHVLRRGGEIEALLRRIPELQLLELDPGQQCCGAAGSYFLTEPEMADQLLARKLDAAAQLAPDLIVSPNVGCSLHLAGGLRRQSSSLAVMHPLSLLAQQLQESAGLPPAGAGARPAHPG